MAIWPASLLALLSTSPTDGCIDPELSSLASSQSVMLCDGTVAHGTLSICDKDGQGGCVVNGAAFKAAEASRVVAGAIRSGVTIAGVAGSFSGGPSACMSDGAVGCLATSSYKSVAAANLAGKVPLGQSVAGVAGTVALPAPSDVKVGVAYGTAGTALTGFYAPDFPAATNVLATATVNHVAGGIDACAAGASDCYLPAYVLSTQPLKAISYDSITPGIIKKNAVIAGVTGDYPSSTYPLAGADATPDLTAANFEAKIKDGATNFEWFDDEGSRYARAGDSDLTASNIKNSVSIFSTTGNLTGLGTADEWNIRAGVTIGSVTGKLKMNCRNGGSTLNFGMGTVKDATVASGTDIFTVPSHGFLTGDVVHMDFTSAPGSLYSFFNYFVIKIDNNSFKLAASAPAAFVPTPIDITADGAGVKVWFVSRPRAATVSSAADTLTVTGHGFSTGQVVQVSYTTTPTGLFNLGSYSVIVVDANTFKLATTSDLAIAGTAINITANGSGVYVFKLGTSAVTTNDTIDDYNLGGAVVTSHPWASGTNFCGGVEAVPGDDNVWKDVTTDGSGAASTCASTPANCAMQDKISGLTWTKTLSTSMMWGKAMDLCKNLDFNHQANGWRLPTQKELIGAYDHGIRSAAGNDWIQIAEMNDAKFWTSTTYSSGLANAYVLNLGWTNATSDTKGLQDQVVCIR